MVYKEEKILLIAKESKDPIMIFDAINQIVENCVISNDFRSASTPLFDLEYLFLRIRMVSVSNMVATSYIDKEDNKQYDFQINLEDVVVKFPENPKENPVKISDELAIKLRYPNGDIYKLQQMRSQDEKDVQKIQQEMIAYCIETVFYKEKTYPIKQETPDEVKKFIENLPLKAYESILEYLADAPKLFYEIKYKNSLGTERSIPLSSIEDFFTFA